MAEKNITPEENVDTAAARAQAESTLISSVDETLIRESAPSAGTTSHYQSAPVAYSSFGSPIEPSYREPSSARAESKGSGSLKSFAFGLLGGLLGAALLFGGLRLSGLLGNAQTQTTLPAASGSSQMLTINPTDDITVARAVAEKTLPSVVSVESVFPIGTGVGSGVMLDEDGNILTNYHVVEDASSITVTIGGESYDARLVGSDYSSDLAVIKANLAGASVTPIEIGDSSELRVGDWVMTVGSPFGLEQSVAQGIVSSLSRNTLLSSTTGNTLYTNLIQVDAAINPGNSGGALVNSQGQLVGISTLFSSDTESFAGIGFAIPGNYAIDIAQKIISGEQVTHAYIGLTMQTVNEQNSSVAGVSVDYGAYVVEVAEGSPAEAAGLQAGDVVVALNGEKVSSADELMLAIRSHKIGETVDVSFLRGGAEQTVQVELGSDEALQELQQKEREELQQKEREQDQFNPFGGGEDLGLSDEEWELLEEWYERLFGGNGQ